MRSMNEYEDWECYNAFHDQCLSDKDHIKELYRRFRARVISCGRHLLSKQVRWAYTVPDDERAASYLEFLDFIDGNGFIIKQVQPDLYHIIPQYPETPTTYEMLPF